MDHETGTRRLHAVFVDPSGRRRWIFRRGGIAVCWLVAGFLVVVGIGLITGVGAPLTPWLGADRSAKTVSASRTGIPSSAPPPRPAAPGTTDAGPTVAGNPAGPAVPTGTGVAPLAPGDGNAEPTSPADLGMNGPNLGGPVVGHQNTAPAPAESTTAHPVRPSATDACPTSTGPQAATSTSSTSTSPVDTPPSNGCAQESTATPSSTEP
jgi:hypothetical protein